MKSRFFGASSYDDENEEEEMDLSGFVTSSETQPVVVERKRGNSVKPSQSDQMFGRSGATNASNMGNAGPKTAPPPPMSNVGRMYVPTYEDVASEGGGYSHLNPIYADDNSKYGKLTVGMKVVGASMMGLGTVTAFATNYKKLGKSMVAVGGMSYAHGMFGIGNGALAQMAGNKSPVLTTMAATGVHFGALNVGLKGLKRATENASWVPGGASGAVSGIALGAGFGSLFLIRQFL